MQPYSIANAVDYIRAGVAQYDQGRYDEALVMLNQAVALAPDNAFAHLYRGYAHMALGNRPAMSADINRAQMLDPRNPEIHFRVGKLLHTQFNYLLAIQSFSCAIECNLDFEEAWLMLGDSYYRYGDTDIARKVYIEAQKKFPNNPTIKMELAYMLPSVANSVDEMDQSRDACMQNLDRLMAENFSCASVDRHLLYFPFFHAYQGRDVRPLLEKLAAFFYKACPNLTYTAPHATSPLKPKEKIRIGFVMCMRFQMILTNFWQPLLQKLAAGGEFEVWLIISDSAPYHPAIPDLTAGLSDYMVLPSDLAASREMIAGKQFDMLAYLEIGMSTHPYFLAMSRLSPIQCNMNGHPMTSGLPTMDYFFSAASLEPAGADAHYTEKLVMFDHNPSVFHRPSLPEMVSREDLGLPVDANLYACPVMLFKIHPDMDKVFASILQRDPKAIIILFDSELKTLWRSLLEKRFASVMPLEHCQRILFLPHAGKERFIQLLTAMDAILDSFHFSFGTTAFLMLGADLPFVTWPGEFMRGRGPHAQYHRMGMTDLIAKNHEEFVELALRFAQDKAFHAEMVEKIRATSDVIFDDYDIVDQFAARLKELYSNHIPSLKE